VRWYRRAAALERCLLWIGRMFPEPTAFAVLPYSVLTVMLKYFYLMNNLNCRGLSLLRGDLWILLTWLETEKTKVPAV